MARLIAAAACSHAFAIEDPAGWDVRRQRNRENFEKLYGRLPAEQPQLESDEELLRRGRAIVEALGTVRERLAAAAPAAVVCIGDDQDEIFRDGNFPQVAIYLGGDFRARGVDRSGPGLSLRGDPELARQIYQGCVEMDLDVMSIEKLPEDSLPSHAFGPVLEVLDPGSRMAVVPVFVNAVHMPAPSPARCHRIGEVIRLAVERDPSARGVAIAASGGLSHYPASFPSGYFQGERAPFPWGAIDEEFDRWVVGRLKEGAGAELTKVTSSELIEHGDVELRSWIALAGAVGPARPELIVYEPIRRGITGMGVAYWNLAASA